jgi:beta-mannosidase
MRLSNELWHRATTEPDRHPNPPGETEVVWERTELPTYGSDDHDHWFRTQFNAAEDSILTLHGLATICEVFIDGSLVVTSESMFDRHDVAVSSGRHELAICARALTAALARPRPGRARWRTKVVTNNNLRWIRTSLLGRAPGFSRSLPLVGPWRSVCVGEAQVEPPLIKASLRDGEGIITVRSDRSLGALEVEIGQRITSLPAGGGDVRIHAPEPWWPHTHGQPTLYPLRISSGTTETRRSVGFRDLHVPKGRARPGLGLRLNGVRIFARGAVWTPVHEDELRPTLERACEAGLNMIRVVGTMTYETSAFHDACDELGLLVWQDLMFANMDYPFTDATFKALALEEVARELAAVAGRPSLVVVCGNSEIEQQVSMLGLDPKVGRSTFFERSVPSLLRKLEIDAAYVSSAPSGGPRPFRTDTGVANYFGVGAYLRPTGDVRRADVRFASECLAFANVPDATPVDHAQGVMRDVGADWDFADVRDHYLESLHGVTPEQIDYWERSRFVTGELMAEVFGEWRRHESSCEGGIVLWLRDLEEGSGWGLLDSRGRPKVAYYHLRRAVQPIAVWITDEGLNGLAVHLANDRREPLAATVQLRLYRDQKLLVASALQDIEVPGRSVLERDAEGLIGYFADISYAYRFGPPQHDLVVASLVQDERLLSQAFWFPGGRPKNVGSAETIGLDARATRDADGTIKLALSTEALAYGIRVAAEGYVADDNGFNIEPAGSRLIHLSPMSLSPMSSNDQCIDVLVNALNLDQPLRVNVNG